MPIDTTSSSSAFADRTVPVTGGRSGIGLGCARTFRDLGARVIATGATKSERVHAAGEPGNADLTFLTLDVRDASGIGTVVASLVRLDIPVNAAGVIHRDAEHDPEIFADVLAINLTGTMRVSSPAKDKLAETRGCVVNIASMLTSFSGPRVPAYSAPKGGIGQLVKSLAAAWALEGIRVNAMAPGWIATSLTQGLQDDPERSRPILSRTPWVAGVRPRRWPLVWCSSPPRLRGL